LKIRKEIDEYAKDLNLRSVKNISNPRQEIETIEGIEIISDFKYIAKSKYWKVFDTENSIESHYRNIYD
jgi:hypothetical protein